MSRNPVARSLAEPKYRERVINGSTRRSWPDLEEFELGERSAVHQATLDAVYHTERLASYCAARTLRDGARR